MFSISKEDLLRKFGEFFECWEYFMSELFYHDLANTYLGKYILVGLTYEDHAGAFLEHVELHGVVRKATYAGIEIELKGVEEGGVLALPPDLSAIQSAAPGVYTLRSTGEKVTDPDLLCTWTLTTPASAGDRI